MKKVFEYGKIKENLYAQKYEEIALMKMRSALNVP